MARFVGYLMRHGTIRRLGLTAHLRPLPPKNDKPQTIPLTSTVAADLQELAAHVAKRDGEFRYFPLRVALLWYMWNQIREDVKKMESNIDDVTLHTLRGTCQMCR